jgi:hypothetical protein
MCKPLRLPRKRSRQWGSRRLRHPDPSRRRSGSLASFRRPSEGADPGTKTLPRGGEFRGAAVRAAATVVPTLVPTVDREGRSEAASVAAGAAGRKSENISHKEN